MNSTLLFDFNSLAAITHWAQNLAYNLICQGVENEQANEHEQLANTKRNIKGLTRVIFTELIQQQQARAVEFASSKLKKKRTFQEKVEEHLRVANEQQKMEKKKDFELILSDIPANILNHFQTEERELNGKLVSVTAYQGDRTHMEDAYLIDELDDFRIGDQTCKFQLVGVFDGHGHVSDQNRCQGNLSPGAQAAHFVRNHLKEELIKALESYNSQNLSEEQIGKALSNSLKRIDQMYAESKGEGGTTAVVALLLGEKVWIGNVGDSRAIFIDKAQIKQVSIDAVLSDERCHQKIYKRGGIILYAKDTYRINALLGMGRAIGDHGIKGMDGLCCVPVSPEISYFSFDKAEENNEYLILMSDGLTAVASTNEIGDTIRCLINRGCSLEDISKQLVYAARASEDNITVAIVKLS